MAKNFFFVQIALGRGVERQIKRTPRKQIMT